ncbi:MAG: PspA/IM30 family protein [Armatimonadota bacterium]
MGWWDRLRRAVKSTKSAEQQVQEQIAALEEAVASMSSAAQRSAAEVARLRREAEEQRKKERTWEDDARDCIRRGDETAARECLQRAEAAKLAAEKAERLAAVAEADADQRLARTSQLRSELEALRAQAAMLSSAGRFAQAEADAARVRAELAASGYGTLDELRRDVEARELDAQVQRELADGVPGLADTAARSEFVEARLAALKAEVGKQALEPSTEDSDRKLSERESEL